MAVNAVVTNTGGVDVPNVDVAVYAWNALGRLELLKAETIPVLAAGSLELVTAAWDSTGKTGDNRMIVVVDPYDAIHEKDETNNFAIQDFFVADKIGIFMSTATDAAQYGSSKNVAISVTVRNTGPAADVQLITSIEDPDGNRVIAFDTRSLAVPYGKQSVQTFVWNTESTYAGPYVVHLILLDGSGGVIAENRLPFTIVSDAAFELSFMTDKAAYGPRETVATSFTARNAGTNVIIATAQAHVTITNAANSAVFTEEKTLFNLLPGSGMDISNFWNTGLSAPGDYQALVSISSGSVTATKSVAFKINGQVVPAGDIAVTPSAVPVNGTTQISYTVTNAGNLNAMNATARITVIDPDTLSVLQNSDTAVDIPVKTAAGAVRSGFRRPDMLSKRISLSWNFVCKIRRRNWQPRPLP